MSSTHRKLLSLNEPVLEQQKYPKGNAIILRLMDNVKKNIGIYYKFIETKEGFYSEIYVTHWHTRA